MQNSEVTKVLVVDDEVHILRAVSFLLEKEGYSVQTAENGHKAIDAYNAFKPDYILLDVMMPEMDGITAAKEIRLMDEQSQTKIVFLTAKGTPQDRMQGYMSGADDYIVKPFKNEDLLSKLEKK